MGSAFELGFALIRQMRPIKLTSEGVLFLQ
jgi:hypothetical protein